ncbi:tail fiber domain-containing protein [Mangrovibacter phragmitis]|uniref:tail fiber domain-containing protein n=1 Tax=Mangrovibacter phragmitis TaxID=1691903 RepID=UPI00336AD9CF
MPAGTITLTNDSNIVEGSGTSFSAEFSSGDILASTVGEVTYTLFIQSVDSDTQVTLVKNYDGPTATGLAWSAIPRNVAIAIPAQIATEVSKALRVLNQDKSNWQQVFSSSGSITVTLPDGSSFSGPSWHYIASMYANKADLIGGAVAVSQGGTGATTASEARMSLGLGDSATRNVGISEGTVAAGDDSRLNTIDGKSGGIVTGGISLSMQNSTYSHPLVLTSLENQEGVRLLGSMATFGDGTSRTILNVDSVGGRRSTLYGTGGYMCQAGINGTPAMASFNVNWDGSNAALWIDSTRFDPLFSIASDKLLKKDIEYIDGSSSLLEVMQWKPASFVYKARGIIPESEKVLGFIANDVVQISPEVVSGDGLQPGYDENDPKDSYRLDPIAMIAKLTFALQAQQRQIDELVKKLSA